MTNIMRSYLVLGVSVGKDYCNRDNSNIEFVGYNIVLYVGNNWWCGAFMLLHM